MTTFRDDLVGTLFLHNLAAKTARRASSDVDMMLWYGHCDCIVDVDEIVRPSALALWLLYIYIGLAVPANT